MHNKVHHHTFLHFRYLASILGIRNDNGLYVVRSDLNNFYRYRLIDTRIAANKPRGLQAARKLRNSRRDNRWVRLPTRPTTRAQIW
jgi:hypothetical protein